MQFTQFDFANFKGMGSAQIDLTTRDGVESRVVTLVGLNESGKTTVLEGIDRFVPGKESEEIGPKHIGDWHAPEPFELIPISQRANFNDDIRIRAYLELDSDDVEFVVKAVAEATGFRLDKVPTSIVIDNRYKFKNSKFTGSVTGWPRVLGEGRTRQGRTPHKVISTGPRRPVWLAVVEAMRLRVPPVWYFPNFLFDFPEKISLVPSAEESSADKLYRSLFQDILGSVGTGLEIDTHVVQRALSTDDSDRRSLEQLRLDIGREVTRSVVAAWNNLFKSGELDGKRVFVNIETEGDDVYASFALEDSDGLFAIKERSLGFRWFFVYLLLTTYRGRRKGPASEIVFLFDEPASNLHTSAQAVLLESLARLSESARIIYTTHSQHLINPAWLESTFVVANEGLDATRVTSRPAAYTDIRVERYATFANSHPNRSHYFQPVLDVLEYQPSQLELVPDVVMTEGKSDYYSLRYFQDVIVNSAGADALHFLPGTGAGTLDLPIQLYSAWARDFVVMLDSDAAGRTARARYIERFGQRLEPLITTLEADLPGIRQIEGVFTDDDRLKLEQLVSPGAKSPTKKGFARGIEHALATKTVVPLSETTRSNLTTLIAGLRQRLRPTSGDRGEDRPAASGASEDTDRSAPSAARRS